MYSENDHKTYKIEGKNAPCWLHFGVLLTSFWELKWLRKSSEKSDAFLEAKWGAQDRPRPPQGRPRGLKKAPGPAQTNLPHAKKVMHKVIHWISTTIYIYGTNERTDQVWPNQVLFNDEADIRTDEFDQTELEISLHKAKNNKSIGPDECRT